MDLETAMNKLADANTRIAKLERFVQWALDVSSSSHDAGLALSRIQDEARKALQK